VRLWQRRYATLLRAIRSRAVLGRSEQPEPRATQQKIGSFPRLLRLATGATRCRGGYDALNERWMFRLPGVADSRSTDLPA
jgi:hypothetical protein